MEPVCVLCECSDQPFLEDLFSKESNEYVMISIMECLCYTGKTLYKDRIKQIYHQNESSAQHDYRMEAIAEGALKRIVEWE